MSILSFVFFLVGGILLLVFVLLSYIFLLAFRKPAAVFKSFNGSEWSKIVETSEVILIFDLVNFNTNFTVYMS